MVILDTFVVMVGVQAVPDVSPSPSAAAHAEADEAAAEQDGSDGNQYYHPDVHHAVADEVVVDVN